MKASALVLGAIVVLLASVPALAWSPKGHAYIGRIADNLLNENASKRVAEILGYDLGTAAKWADCVRSVRKGEDGAYKFTTDPKHPEYTEPCAAFMSSAKEVARMEDYAGRNWDNCAHEKDRGCHESYHFADVDRKRSRYDRSFVGTSDHDVVSAIEASVAVLEDKGAPKPFSIKDKKEALLLIAHFVGDLHQPLHVGAIYLTASGDEIDADADGADFEGAETHGGNWILDDASNSLRPPNLHYEWDAIPASLGDRPGADVIAAAQATGADDLPAEKLAEVWATDSVVASSRAWDGITFSAIGKQRWSAHLPAGYVDRKEELQKTQIIKAGAHLAALLNKIWPAARTGDVTPNSAVQSSVVVRERASVNAHAIGSIRPTERMQFAGKSGRWYRVLLQDGRVGYVNAAVTRLVASLNQTAMVERGDATTVANAYDQDLPAGIDQVNATVWMRSAPEYAGNALSTYTSAARQLQTIASNDDREAAVLEQEGQALESLPPAVILDLDETVLDNSEYQAEGILSATPYEDTTWNDWVKRDEAGAVPGAASFLSEARDLGFAIIFITNRSCFPSDAEAEKYFSNGNDQASSCQSLGPTISRLTKLFGFTSVDVLTQGAPTDRNGLHAWIMPKYFMKDWKEKTVRRALVARQYWIAMALGDDLRDFVDPKSYAERGEELRKRWGRSWFILPNAMYGGWERAVSGSVGAACGKGSETSQGCINARILSKYEWLRSHREQRPLE